MKKNNINKAVTTLAILLTLGLIKPSVVFSIGPTSVDLLSTSSFSVMAGSTITNTGATVISNDLGLSPSLSVTGFPPGIVNGTQNISNAKAIQAQVDLTSVYNDLAGRTPVLTVPAELGGTTKIAGVYDSISGIFGITGTLILDAQNDPNAVFIFKTASTLTTAGSSVISLINGAQACNVFWQIGSSATLGTNSIFKGNIIALTSITLVTGASVDGRLLARNGAVTLDTNAITSSTCATIVVPTPIATITPIPEPVVTPVIAPTVTPIPDQIIIPNLIETPVPTIVIAPPKLPNAGFAPEEKNNILNIFIFSSALILFSYSMFVVFKKHRV